MRAITDMLWMFMGLIIYIISEVLPITRMIALNWIGVGLMFFTPIMYLYHFKSTKTYELFNKLASNKALMPFLRRDGTIIPVQGTRVYSGESFLDVPGLGLVEDLGKGTVYTWGDKKIRFGMENISFTPDPHYWNLTAEYHRLGFNDSDDIYNALTGKDLELMAATYLKMVDEKQPRGAEKIVESILENIPDKPVVFKPAPKSKDVHESIDKLIGG